MKIKVIIFGTFDIVHMGHIHMFKQAREYGDRLIVVVGRDKNVEKAKGIAPLHSEKERVEFLKNIKLIDEVELGFEDDKYQIIKKIKPDVIALGYDQTVDESELREYVKQLGLKAEVIRLKPHKKNMLKTNKIKKYLERLI